MVGVGVWAYIEKNKYYYQDIETIYDVLLDLSILLMIVGAVIFIVGYAGCVGALRENICLLRIVSNIQSTLVISKLKAPSETL